MSYGRRARAERELAAEVAGWLARAEGKDAADDVEYGPDRRGDELPDWIKDKQARGFRQFLLRGSTKVAAEWALVCTAHNLTKLLAARTT